MRGGFVGQDERWDVGSLAQRRAVSSVTTGVPEVAPTWGSRWTHVKCSGSTTGAAAEAGPSPDGLLGVGEQTWSGESWHSRGDVTPYADGCCGRPV